jgi:hypothetical protein
MFFGVPPPQKTPQGIFGELARFFIVVDNHI